ncbi:unnamed protein product [Brachionus calyciflorus]|uniref:EF-hand domain-containing protein n=1 Tax=Brachionus calyciflorus TaxID=104777 RepID=A0A813S625_9BILA|nr:unnamed protein product [Brachionus calyciflorus]
MGNLCQHNSKDFTKLSEQEIQILLENTPFDRDQIDEWHKGFLKDCPDGRMTKYKLIEFYKMLYPYGKVEQFCKRVFKVFDRDNSGEIDFVELMTSISITASSDLKQKLTLSFKLFDTDNSGTIRQEELLDVIESIYALTLKEKDYRRRKDPYEIVDLIMEKFDTNKNNYLVKEDFFQGCLNNPSLAELIVP